MFKLPEQFSSATQTQLDAMLSLCSTAFGGVEQIIGLNMSATKSAIDDASNTARKLLLAQNPQEFFSLTVAQAQPTAAKALAYGRHLAGIAASTQAEFTRAAEEQIAEASRKASELIDNVSKNAPAGSENVIAIVKSAIGNANAGYEQFTKTTKQAVEAMEANMNSAVNQFSQATEKTAGRARK